MIEIHGHCAPKFDAVKAAFANNFATQNEIGASVAISHEGELVTDIWAGHLTAERTTPWTQDTLVNVWSSTKTMAAMCLLLLADRGEVDLHAPAATYWPEFAAAGKDAVEVRYFLSHTAGLSGLDTPVQGDALYDWDWMVKQLAAQAPWWEPGTASGYHALTQGHLIGEIVRRVTGQSIGQFFAQEIADPLQADFHIGIQDAEIARTSPLTPPENQARPVEDGSIAARTFANPALQAEQAMHPGWRAAEIPAANGHGNARSIVRIQTAMANGGEAFGKQILSQAGTRRVFEQQSSGIDLVLGIPVTFGMGYGINNPAMPIGPNKNIAFWGGYGGSLVLIDQDARLSVAYVMNRMEPGTTGDVRGLSIVMAAYQALLGG
jgi:CubicO group peptidase (beta-lactamase class C family)